MKLLPSPTDIVWRDGAFTFPNPLPVRSAGRAARVLARRLKTAVGIDTTTGEGLGVDFHTDDTLAPEAYRLTVTPEGVTIWSADDAGAGWAVQTLLQLLPVHIHGPGPMEPSSLVVPAVDITDAPAHGWRGSHIDVARHFLPLDGLLKHLDVMAAHKLNVLHLHLTDDQGWRLPVAKYPKLTEEGAWRPGTLVGHQPPPDENDCDDVAEHDGVPHGGAYTEDELRHLVAYAAELGITVMPEIDMPGHMEAAIAAYPHLGACDHVRHPRTAFGVSEHVLSLNDDVIQFCKDVLDAAMELFPGSPIHIGGDECPSAEWFQDPASLETMERHGLTTGAEAQAWFEREICAYLVAAGRRVVVWDEVLDAGAPDGVTIMVWRTREGQSRIEEAARQGLDVIAAPVGQTYLDYTQYDHPGEPLSIGGTTPLADVARLTDHMTVPEGREHHLLGGQFQLWTEYVRNWDRAEYQLWPRGAALAQQLWSGGVGDAGTLDGLGHHLDRLTAMQLNWCRPPRTETG